MNKHLIWLPLILLILGSAAVSTNAQTAAYGVRATVPFDFIVGDKTIPAGKVAARLGNSSDAGPMSIVNTNTGKRASRMATRLLSATPSDQAKLVFRRYGDTYYLAQVWMPGSRAWEIVKSKAERELDRHRSVAKNNDPEIVTVMAGMQ